MPHHSDAHAAPTAAALPRASAFAAGAASRLMLVGLAVAALWLAVVWAAAS